jgi:hypothetical protein
MTTPSFFIVFFLAFVYTIKANGNELIHRQNLHQVVAIYEDQFIRIPPPESFLSKSSSDVKCDIQVNYNDFPESAQTAFEYAVSIWESLLSSEVPINIQAFWIDLGSYTSLGAAGPTNYYIDKEEFPHDKVFYNNVLAEKYVGKGLNSDTSPDIVAYFGSNVEWYFGTDGETPAGKFDFVSVVLHELCHGLGFLGSIDVDEDQLGLWGYGGSYPLSFDRFIYNGDGQKLIDQNIFTNPSAQIYNQLVSDNLYFEGPALRFHYGDRVRLYAPEEFREGVSVDHLDDEYNDTPDQLMTSGIAQASSIHNPGLITLSMMEDIGWTNMKITHQAAESREVV